MITVSKVNISTWVKNFGFLLEAVIPLDAVQLNVGKKISDFNNNLKLAKDNKEIVRTQAKIIDCKLRQAFSKLSINDFSDPSGFAEMKKASFRVKHYLDVRSTLESYIKNNIEGYKQKELQLRGFQQWLMTAEHLQKAQCYEGAFLVINALLQLDIKFKLTPHLSASDRRKFANHMEMISPSGNFIKLRKEIAQAKSAQKFVPVFLRAKDITTLNYLLEENSNAETKEANFKKKIGILKGIKQEQTQKVPALPDELEKIYQRAQARYGSECHVAAKHIEDKNQFNSSSNKADLPAGNETTHYRVIKIRTEKSTRVYLHNELPSFWQKEYRETVQMEQLISQSSINLAR